MRVQLSNNCGKTKWIEITKSEGVSLWDPSRGTPISIDCLPGPNEDGPSYSILGLSLVCELRKESGSSMRELAVGKCKRALYTKEGLILRQITHFNKKFQN